MPNSDDVESGFIRPASLLCVFMSVRVESYMHAYIQADERGLARAVLAEHHNNLTVSKGSSLHGMSIVMIAECIAFIWYFYMLVSVATLNNRSPNDTT